MIGDRNATESSSRSEEANERSVAASDLFEMLADPSRRRVLRELRGAEGRITVHELADRLADERGDRRASDPRAERDSDQFAIRLHHSHLPKLDDCGLVDYEPDAHAVVAEIPAWVEPYLDVVADD